MSVSAGADYSYSLIAGTSTVDQRSATLRGKGATVVVANWGQTSDTRTEDSVNLISNLSQISANTPTAKLTTALAKLLQESSHVDAETGSREINQGISDTLASEVGKLLVGSGFSKSDAANASSSLVKQFTSSTSGSNVLALSLSSQNKNVGSYKTSVDGGTEASAYSVQSTSTLNLTFNTGTGDLSLKLDQHKVAATRIEWSSATATDVTISLSQPELEAINFAPLGTFQNDTGSPVKESQTITSQGAPGMGIGSSNVSGPNALSKYRDFENEVSSATGTASLAQTTVSTQAGTSLSGIQKTKSSAELAVISLKKMVADAKLASTQQNQTVGFSITQKLGTAVSDTKGGRFLLYGRPNGGTGSIGLTGIRVQA